MVRAAPRLALSPSSWRLPVFWGGLGAPPRTRGPRARCSGCTAMGTSLWLRSSCVPSAPVEEGPRPASALVRLKQTPVQMWSLHLGD